MRAALNELELPDSVDELSVIHIFFALPRLRALAFVCVLGDCLSPSFTFRLVSHVYCSWSQGDQIVV